MTGIDGTSGTSPYIIELDDPSLSISTGPDKTIENFDFESYPIYFAVKHGEHIISPNGYTVVR
jgi:hypothetical protein